MYGTSARFEPQAAEGLQPVVWFVDRVPVPVKAVNKTFFGPVIKVIGWVERDKVPGWRERDADCLAARGPAALGRLVGSSSGSGDACSQEAGQGQAQGQTERAKARYPIDESSTIPFRGNDDERRRHRPSARGDAPG